MQEELSWQKEAGILAEGGISAGGETLASPALRRATPIFKVLRICKETDFILRVRRHLLRDFKLKRDLVHFRRIIWQECKG